MGHLALAIPIWPLRSRAPLLADEPASSGYFARDDSHMAAYRGLRARVLLAGRLRVLTSVAPDRGRGGQTGVGRAEMRISGNNSFGNGGSMRRLLNS
jgi:hypothetical protein